MAKAGRSKKTFDQIDAEERLQEEVDRVAELGLSNEKVKKLSKVGAGHGAEKSGSGETSVNKKPIVGG